MKMNGPPIASGMGTCGLVGQIGVYTGWVSDIAAGVKSAITFSDWAALLIDQLYSAGGADLAHRAAPAPHRLDCPRRPEARLSRPF